MRKILLITLALCFASACSKQAAQVQESLVVEGWIDDGGYPVVIVTTTIPRPDTPQEVSELFKNIVRGAQVSISDGNNMVGLIGMPSSDNFPPYIYTTRRMKGEAGKTYSLNVSARGYDAEAVATVRTKKELTGIRIEGTEGNYKIMCTFDASPGEYYAFFVKDGNGLGWSPVFLGLVNGSETPGTQTVAVIRGNMMSSITAYSAGFSSGEKVQIRFCTMDFETWDYWRSLQDITGISFLVTYPFEETISSNMHGAYGYWAGYGASEYEITVRPMQ